MLQVERKVLICIEHFFEKLLISRQIHVDAYFISQA